MKRMIALAAAALGIGCEGAADRPAAPPADSATSAAPAHHFTVDSARYALRPADDGLAASIGFVFRNERPDTLYVVQCNGHVVMDLQKRMGAGWQTVWYGMSNGCLSPAIEVAPHDSLTGRIEVWGALPGHPTRPTFETAELDGEFRLIWHQPRLHYTVDAPNFGDTLSIAERSTMPFRLHRPADDGAIAADSQSR